MKRIRALSKVRVVDAYIQQGPFLNALEKVLRSQMESLGDKGGKTPS